MASLSIAKATLLASCLRPDVTKLTRDDLDEFHTLLETSITRCTPLCFQSLNLWVERHIAPSTNRITAFSKYLKSFSKYLGTSQSAGSRWKERRQQLHVLYFLNDVLHHLKHHSSDPMLFDRFAVGTVPILLELFANPAREKKPRVLRRLNELAEIWKQASYYDDLTLAQVRESIVSGESVVRVDEDNRKAVAGSKEAPWIMPATHGEANTPYCDLPAANMMPHIVPNSSRPIRSDSVRALQLPGGPADQSLVHAVKDFLEDVKTIEDPYTKFDVEGTVIYLDDIGQLSYTNEAGDQMGDTYYGWSRSFCDKMKARAKEVGNNGARRSYSEASSRSVSGTPRKRRRYGASRSRSRSSTRERSRSISAERPARGLGRPNSPPAPHAGQYMNLQPPPPLPLTTMPPAMPSMPGITMGIPPRPPTWMGPWPPPPPPPPPPNVGGVVPPPLPQQDHNSRNFDRR